MLHASTAGRFRHASWFLVEWDSGWFTHAWKALCNTSLAYVQTLDFGHHVPRVPELFLLRLLQLGPLI